LETLTVAVFLFAVLGVAVAVALLCLSRFARRPHTKWFWPDPRKARRYGRVAFLNAGLSLVFFALCAGLDGAALLVSVALMTTAAVVATYSIVVKPLRQSEQFNSLREFWWARTAFLLAVAAVPAIACFQIAYNFEMALFVRSDQAYQQMRGEAREKR